MKSISMLLFSAFILFVGAALPVSAHADHDETALVVVQPWAPHTGKRTMSAAIYFSVQNNSGEADALIDVRTDAAHMATLHRSYEENTIMRMDHVKSMHIPAGGSISLAPGGYHIMLMQLTEPLKRGQHFPLTLVFEKAGELSVSVEITGIGGPE